MKTYKIQIVVHNNTKTELISLDMFNDDITHYERTSLINKGYKYLTDNNDGKHTILIDLDYLEKISNEYDKSSIQFLLVKLLPKIYSYIRNEKIDNLLA